MRGRPTVLTLLRLEDLDFVTFFVVAKKGLFLALIVLPKSIDPMRLLVTKHEKIVPKGATAPSPK